MGSVGKVNRGGKAVMSQGQLRSDDLYPATKAEPESHKEKRHKRHLVARAKRR